MSRPTYAYESAQHSILLPLYRQYLWKFILEALPRSLSPNAMTIISTACCVGSFLIATTLRHSGIALFCAAFLVLCYFTFDNLDGAQARRVGRSSRMGEFLDHWLDTLNNGFVVIGACVVAGLPPLFILAVLCCGTVAFFAVQWELRSTGVFRMGRIADIEGNTAVALLYLSVAIVGQEAFANPLLPGLPTAATLLGWGVIAQALWTILSAVRATSHRRGEFLPLIAASGVLGLWALQGEQTPACYLAIAFLLNPVFTSKPIRERLRMPRVSPVFDWAVVGAIAIAAALSSAHVLGVGYGALIGNAVVAGLAALTLRFFITSVARLKNEPSAKSLADSAWQDRP